VREEHWVWWALLFPWPLEQVVFPLQPSFLLGRVPLLSELLLPELLLPELLLLELLLLELLLPELL